MRTQLLFLGTITILFASCVSNKKFKVSQKSIDDLKAQNAQLQKDLKDCVDKKEIILQRRPGMRPV